MRPGSYWWMSKIFPTELFCPQSASARGVLELQAVFEDPIARVVQRCALLSSSDAHLDDFRAAPALRGERDRSMK
jgi:hypothetical protein